MSIYGIGTDILDIRRIGEIFSKKYYKRFCNRILSQATIFCILLYNQEKFMITYNIALLYKYRPFVTVYSVYRAEIK